MQKNKSLSDAEKEKILKKIAIELKSAKKKKFEKSEKIEEEPKEFPAEENSDENLDNFEFSSFNQQSQNSEIKTPVLERIALSSPKPIFVGKIPQTSSEMFGEEKDKGNSNYLTSAEKRNEPVYEAAPEKANAMAERIDFSTIGRELPRAISEEQGNIPFKNFEPRIEPATTERAWTAERIDVEKTGRKNPFEREEEKYKTYKPKIPKGY